MEKLARKLASNIAKSLNYDDEKERVIAYGLTAMFQAAVTILLILIFGLIAGSAVEALILCFSVSLLRKYSGGAHVSFIELCTLLGIIYCVAFSLVSKYVLSPIVGTGIMIAANIIIYGLAYLAIYQLAPVDSPNKPIRTLKKKKRMRKGAYITLSVYLAASIIFLLAGLSDKIMNSYGISLLFGISWQIFTLTEPGSCFLHKVDLMFRNPQNISKGGELE